MHRLSRTALLAFAAAAFLACSGSAMAEVAESGAARPERTPPKRKAAGETIRAVAEITQIDPELRRLTLKREDGNTLVVVADASVRNLSRLHPGDFVLAEYGRAQILALRKQPPADNGMDAEPHPMASDPLRMRIVADIIAIDDRLRQLTLKGLRGHVVDAVVSHRRMLASVKVGDHVAAEYREATAFSIRPADSISTRRR